MKAISVIFWLWIFLLYAAVLVCLGCLILLWDGFFWLQCKLTGYRRITEAEKETWGEL